MERGVQNEIEVEFALQHFYYNYPRGVRPEEPKKTRERIARRGGAEVRSRVVQAPCKGCNVLVVTARGESCSCYSKDCRKTSQQCSLLINCLASLNKKAATKILNFFLCSAQNLPQKLIILSKKKRKYIAIRQQSKLAATIEG